MGDLTLKEKIDAALEPFGSPPWGVCDVDQTLPLPEKYEKALTVVVPFSDLLTLDEYTEPRFRGAQASGIMTMRRIAAVLSGLLRAEGIRFGPAPSTEDGEKFEREMTELFSTKEAARRAGLGWIGKSNLLVTERYGPRLSILTYLCDISLPSGEAVDKSRCGECTRCTKNCAYQAIHGKLWEPGVRRGEQVDYAKCSTSRLKGYEVLGRKISCGKCIAACPYGSKKSAKSA